MFILLKRKKQVSRGISARFLSLSLPVWADFQASLGKEGTRFLFYNGKS